MRALMVYFDGAIGIALALMEGSDLTRLGGNAIEVL